jgi:two-component system, LuxR family, sensor kinase FixL
MAASLADELNQPLTAITNYVQGLKLALSRRPAGSDPNVTAALDGAETSARLAGGIVRRIQNKTALIRLERQPEPLSQLIGDAARVALAGLPQNAVQVKLAIPRKANRVLVDRVQIQHVLVNLIRNAIEAMKDEATRPEIAIQASVNVRGDVEIRVVDRGPGISEGVALRLFEPFVSTKEKGAGIGLAVCRTIVEAHGGRMWVEPGQEGGTSIGFTLQGGDRGGRDDAARARAA